MTVPETSNGDHENQQQHTASLPPGDCSTLKVAASGTLAYSSSCSRRNRPSCHPGCLHGLEQPGPPPWLQQPGRPWPAAALQPAATGAAMPAATATAAVPALQMLLPATMPALPLPCRLPLPPCRSCLAVRCRSCLALRCRALSADGVTAARCLHRCRCFKVEGMLKVEGEGRDFGRRGGH